MAYLVYRFSVLETGEFLPALGVRDSAEANVGDSCLLAVMMQWYWDNISRNYIGSEIQFGGEGELYCAGKVPRNQVRRNEIDIARHFWYQQSCLLGRHSNYHCLFPWTATSFF